MSRAVCCENTNYKLLLDFSVGNTNFLVENAYFGIVQWTIRFPLQKGAAQPDTEGLLERKTPRTDISYVSLNLGKRLYPGHSQENILSVLHFYDDIIFITHLTAAVVAAVVWSDLEFYFIKQGMTCPTAFTFIHMWENQYTFQPTSPGNNGRLES